MADDSVQQQFDYAAAEKVGQYVGHYVAAVVERLLEDDVPVIHVEVMEPTPVAEGKKATEYEATVYIFFAIDFRRALAGHDGDASLDWSETSGWSVSRDPSPESLPDLGDRWMGAGVAPHPDRVARFLTGAQLDFTSAGSVERPYYRNSTGGHDDILRQLAPYLP